MAISRVTKRLLWAMICAAVASAALALIPLGYCFGQGIQKVVSLLLAVLFWGCLLAEQIFFWSANAGRKKIQRRAFGGKRLVKPTLGLISFGFNKEARIADIAFFALFIAMILVIAFRVQNEWIVTLTLALFLLSFTFHCIFNGTTYRYIKAFHHIKKEPKQNENTK